MGPKALKPLPEYREFEIEVGHSGDKVLKRAAWCRNKKGSLVKALGQTDAEVEVNAHDEIDKFWEGRRFG